MSDLVLHELSAVSLITLAVRGNLWECRPRNRRVRATSLWSAVSEQFAIGSTYSKDLCRKIDVDPDRKA